MENLVINDVTQLIHELQNLPQCLICTSCTDYDKLQSLLKYCQQIDIAIGYQHQISTKLQNLPLYSVENLIKKIEFEISIGTNNIKPAFIGVIKFNEFDFSNQICLNIMDSYIKCSEINNIPIVVDHNHNIKFKEIQEKYNKSKAKFIMLNPYIQIIKTRDIYQIKKEINIKSIDLEQNIIFNKNETDYELLSLLKVHFTPGIKYKTHLKQNGGDGFEIVSQDTSQIFNLLRWSTEVVQIVEIRMWKCPICNKEQGENVDRYKKNGKEFCSMKCLRQGIS